MSNSSGEAKVCEALRRQIREHGEAIRRLRNDLSSYSGIGHDIQVGDEANAIQEQIAQHQRAIEELQMGLESQGCSQQTAV
jgi:hypothetical protein